MPRVAQRKVIRVPSSTTTSFPPILSANLASPSPLPQPSPHASSLNTPHLVSPSPSLQLSPHTSPLNTPPLASTPVISPSPTCQADENPQVNQEESASTPTTNEILDKRVLIGLHNDNFEPKNPAFGTLKIIIHSHFDGPYPCWSEVNPSTNEHWWKTFKKSFKWDENRFSDEAVRRLFNRKGSKHLSTIFQKARGDEKQFPDGAVKPIWMKEEIWEQLLHIWTTDERFLRRSEVNKHNRAVATDKGLPAYRGGSISVTEHKKRLKTAIGIDPNPKQTFEKCYTKRDGTWSAPKAQEIVEKFDHLVEEATQGGPSSEGSHSVDMNLMWIKAAGEVNRGRIFGMGSEARSMIQVSQYNLYDGTSISTNQVYDSSCEIDELRAEIECLKTNFGDKVQQVESSLGEKVQQVESSLMKKVQEVENGLGDKVQQFTIGSTESSLNWFNINFFLPNNNYLIVSLPRPSPRLKVPLKRMISGCLFFLAHPLSQIQKFRPFPLLRPTTCSSHVQCRRFGIRRMGEVVSDDGFVYKRKKRRLDPLAISRPNDSPSAPHQTRSPNPSIGERGSAPLFSRSNTSQVPEGNCYLGASVEYNECDGEKRQGEAGRATCGRNPRTGAEAARRWGIPWGFVAG